MITATKKKNTREAEMIEAIREHLGFVATNIGKVPDAHISKTYKQDIKDMISRLRFFCSHKYWEDGEGPPTPISHIFNMICKKNGGVAKLTGIISGPRLAGWTRLERQQKDMLKACFIRACNYVPDPEYNPQWLLPKDDPRNDHPAAIRYREQEGLQKELDKKAKHAELMAKTRKKERLETEAKERAKATKKQRADREKHFKEQERLRSGKHGN